MDNDSVSLMLNLGEKIAIKGRTVTVTDTAYEHLPRVRDYLIEVARSKGTTSYGDLVTDLQLPYHQSGLGRLLDLLWEDCNRRREPSLAAIVVSAATGEVGKDFAGDPVSTRNLLYRYWSSGP